MFLKTYITLLEIYISMNLNESYMKVISPTSITRLRTRQLKKSVKTPSIQLKLLFSAVENHTFNKLRHISHLLLFDIPQQFSLILHQNHTIVNKMILNRKPSINQDFFAKLGKNLKQTMIC